MKINLALLTFLIADSSQLGARADDDDRRGLRGPKPEGRDLARGGNGFGVGRGGFGGGGRGGGRGDKRDDEGGRRNERSGRVIIGRKSETDLKTKGKSKGRIAQMRAKALNQIKKNKVLFESRGDHDFQVVEVEKGKEKEFIENLMANDKEGLFRYAEVDAVEYPAVVPDEGSQYDRQYHHGLMQSELAWDVTQGLSNITVAICDTGLEPNHPDLEGNRLPGYHATTQTWEEDGGDVSNVHPHGTQCAGCAAAIGNNGEGLSGVGWNFKHRPGRVSDSSGGGASSSVLADCARRMCELPDVKVVSVSYSGVEGAARRDAAAYCKTQGALMVNAAGNDARDLSGFGEADDDDLIVVGASTSGDDAAGFSAHGRFVDVWAPGSSVWTTTTGKTYGGVSGTSFSCPLVAGLIALIWSADPQLSPDQVEAILKTSTDDVGIQSVKNTPYGRINSLKAVQLAGGYTSPPTGAPTPCVGEDTTVTIETDNYPVETAWTLTNTCTGGVQSGGGYTSPGSTYTEAICGPDDQYTFTINDSYGDGLCCTYGQGSYKVERGGAVVASGGNFGSSESTTFGVCGGGNPVTPNPTKNPTPNPVTPNPTKNPTPNPVTPNPTVKPTASPVAPNPTKNPTPNPVTPNPVTPNPTTKPTASPVTPIPTKNPTPNPVTPNPTMKPTASPVTPNPTDNPTAATPSSEVYLACGNSGNQNCEALIMKADVNEEHEVRCCSDADLGQGWTRNPGCSVWGESEIGGACNRDETFADAEAKCSSAGARLCTLEEMTKDCTKGTGCSFDKEMIWTSTPVAPCTSDALCDDGIQCTTDTCVNGECQHEPMPDCTTHAIVGGASHGNWPRPRIQEADGAELHEVRCCSDSAIPGWVKNHNCAVWGESDVPGCNSDKTLAVAINICSSAGGRLCTQEEIMGDCTRASGCNFDHAHVWTSSTYYSDQMERIVTTVSPDGFVPTTTEATPAWTTTDSGMDMEARKYL